MGGAGGGVGLVAGVDVRAGVRAGVLLAGVWYLFLYQIFGAMLLRGRWSRILTS